MNETNTQIDPAKLAIAITKGLGYAENGGKPNIDNPLKGKTGEMKSIFQFEPATWKLYSKEVFGKEVPMTADNESNVVLAKVSKWVQKKLKEGKKPEQIIPEIASAWNAGPAESNAYTGHFSDGSSSKSTNKKYGVKFDVPDYAKRVTDYTNQFLNGSKDAITQPIQNSTNESTPVTITQPNVAKVTQEPGGVLSLKGKATQAPKANPGLIKK